MGGVRFEGKICIRWSWGVVRVELGLRIQVEIGVWLTVKLGLKLYVL